MGGPTGRRATRRTVLGSIATGSLVATSGCAALQPPDLTDVRVSPSLGTPTIGSTSLTLPIILEIHNDGDSHIPGTTVDFDVRLNGRHVATAATSTAALGPHDLTTSRVVVNLEYNDVGHQVIEALKRGSVTITLNGHVTATGPLGIFSPTRTFEAQSQAGISQVG